MKRADMYLTVYMTQKVQQVMTSVLLVETIMDQQMLITKQTAKKQKNCWQKLDIQMEKDSL